MLLPVKQLNQLEMTYSFASGPVLLLMISSLLLVVKKEILWPNLDHLYLNVLEEVRYVDTLINQYTC